MRAHVFGKFPKQHQGTSASINFYKIEENTLKINNALKNSEKEY